MTKPSQKLEAPKKPLTLRELTCGELKTIEGGRPPPGFHRNLGSLTR